MTTAAQPVVAAPSFLRQLDMFNPETFPHACHVIGVGAVGSWVATLLTHHGVPTIHLYDDDTLQQHNVPSGAFAPQGLGLPKVTALHTELSHFPATTITCHRERVSASRRFSGIVFLCVDSMETRREIWHSCLRYDPSVPLVVEIRIGPQEGRIYTLDPSDSLQVESWEAASAYASGHAEALPCTRRSIAATVATVAALAVNQLIAWHAGKEVAHCISVGLDRIPLVVASRWTLTGGRC